MLVASIPSFFERLNRHFCSLPYYTLTKAKIGMENKKHNLSRSSPGETMIFPPLCQFTQGQYPVRLLLSIPGIKHQGSLEQFFKTPCNSVRHWLLKNGVISLWVMIMTHILGKGNATLMYPRTIINRHVSFTSPIFGWLTPLLYV